MTQQRRRRFALVVPILVSFALAVGAVAAVGSDSDPADLPSADPAPQPARGLIVKLSDDAESDLTELADDVADELPDGVSVADTSSGSADLGLLALSEQVEADDLDEAITQLEARDDVAWAIPNGVRFPSAGASEPYYRAGRLWQLKGKWSVRANKAWDVTTGSPSVRVAVVDTGLLTTHPDLAGQWVPGRDFVDDDIACFGQNCYYQGTFISANDGDGWDADATDPGDWRSSGHCPGQSENASTWHGTHVAGIVAAKRNGVGAVGVAPTVKVQPVRVLGRCGGSDWDIAMGVLWASGVDINAYDRSHGRIPVNPTPAKIINLSLGGWTESSAQAKAACRLYGQVSALVRRKGAILIAAAGNMNGNEAQNVPSSCPGYLSVAATGKKGLRAKFSNKGAGVDLAAPGVGIWSTSNNGGTTVGAHSYRPEMGTSMAAPAVSGVAALAYSVGIRNPAVVERVLKATARRARGCKVSQCGAGVVDAQAVLKAKAPTSAPRIRGEARPGRTLRATTGRWRNKARVQLTWLRGGKVVARGKTYRVKKADIGKRITVRATAKNGHPAIYHQSSRRLKVKSTLTVSGPTQVKASKRARIRVKVSAPSVRPTGKIGVYDGTRRIAVVKLTSKHRGSVTIRLPRLKKGKHTIRVVYSGSGKVTKSTKRKTVRSR